MARELGIHSSTANRELRRNASSYGYDLVLERSPTPYRPRSGWRPAVGRGSPSRFMSRFRGSAACGAYRGAGRQCSALYRCSNCRPRAGRSDGPSRAGRLTGCRETDESRQDSASRQVRRVNPNRLGRQALQEFTKHAGLGDAQITELVSVGGVKGNPEEMMKRPSSSPHCLARWTN